jgi:curved DNA-binding protein CbpA
MKDYYKILGVDEGASDEEIRSRWTELTDRYHPDQGKTKQADEKIKEINEAYEVLMDNFKRFDYDFERAFKRSLIKKAHRRNERRNTTRKIILPAGLLVLFLIVSAIYLRWFYVVSHPESGIPGKIDRVLEKETVSQIPPAKPESRVQGYQEAPKEIKKKEVIPPESKKMVSLPPPRSPSEVESESKKKEESAEKIIPKSKTPAKVEEEVPVKEEPKPVKERVPQVAMKSEAPARVEKEVPKEVSKGVPKEVTEVIPHPEEKMTIKTEEEKKVTKEMSKVIQPESAPMDKPKPAAVKPQPVQKPEPSVRAGKVVSGPPPSFVKEEEVKRFFSNYIDRYTRKDVDGFLSFFSSKSVQNQKDGFNGIRDIYTKFFDQSQELRYRVEGMKIEIYQNAVEVRARFRVDQKLKESGKEKVWKGSIRWVLVKEDGNLKISSLDYQNEKSP